MPITLALIALVLGVSLIFAAIVSVAFLIGVRYGTKQQEKVKTEVKTIEIPQPFVVEKHTIREVSAPGFIYHKPGTPDVRQEAEDRKMQELITEPEL